MSTTAETMTGLLREKFRVSIPLSSGSKINEIGLDSLDVINFLYSLEELFGVAIPDEAVAAEKLETIDDFARYIDARR